MTIRLWQALGIPEPTYSEIQQLMSDSNSGEVPLPDPNARIG
jgi:hypothetical protein